jgi:ABC-type multidrug transport system fused ATPase/permease subunit
MARLVKVMRLSPDLRLMLDSLFHSVVALFWSILMLGIICFAFGLIFVQFAGAFLEDIQHNTYTQDVKQKLLDHYGSVQMATFTLYKVTTGGIDWIEAYDSIAVIGTVCKCVFVLFIAFIQIAVLNIVTGLFVNTALSFAEPSKVELVESLRVLDGADGGTSSWLRHGRHFCRRFQESTSAS